MLLSFNCFIGNWINYLAKIAKPPGTHELILLRTALAIPDSLRLPRPILAPFRGLRVRPIDALRKSTYEGAMEIVTLHDRHFPDGKMPARAFDYLVAASGADREKIIGIIAESFLKDRALKAQLMAACKAPEIIEARSQFAVKESANHADAKMVLQTAGVVSVPKSQISHVNIIGSKIESNTLNVNVPRLEDVVRVVDSIDANVRP